MNILAQTSAVAHNEVNMFDSSIIFILRGGILRPKGNFPESLSQAMLVGIILAGRLGGTLFRSTQLAHERVQDGVERNFCWGQVHQHCLQPVSPN